MPIMCLIITLGFLLTPHVQIWILEKTGGSLVAGAIKGFQDKQNNPGPPRNPMLPPKPAGQTVGSFRKGLQTLPEAISRNIKDTIR